MMAYETVSCSVVSDSFATPWTVALQAPLFNRISQARTLEWVANSFSRGSFPHRDRTWVSHIAGRFFTIFATREAAYDDLFSLIFILSQLTCQLFYFKYEKGFISLAVECCHVVGFYMEWGTQGGHCGAFFLLNRECRCV